MQILSGLLFVQVLAYSYTFNFLSVEESEALALPENYFDQKISHKSTQTFKQRYYFNNQYYETNGPTFLYIGGEGELSSRSISSGYPFELAKSFGAKLYALEHRYYGKSSPFLNLTLENLQYLSSELAIEDLRYFITEMKLNKVILVGGSYPATLAAWTKYLYPNLVVGSYASSPPLIAKRDYFEYDLVVQKAIGKQCTKTFNRVSDYLSDAYLLNSTKRMKYIRDVFDKTLIDRNYDIFLFTFADILAHLVQYSNSISAVIGKPNYKELCSKLETKEKIETQVEIVADYFGLVLKDMNNTWTDFSSINELISIKHSNTKSSRQWTYQCCTEFGFWQTSPFGHKNYLSTRSRLLTVDKIEDQYCGMNVFGKKIGPPSTEQINKKYMGKLITEKLHNTIIVNGLLDPWSVLSVTNTSLSTLSTTVIKIDDGSHCSDFGVPKTEDSVSLKSARSMIRKTISVWLSNYHN